MTQPASKPNAFVEFIKVNAKSLAAFVVGLVLSAVQDVLNGRAPWPTTLAEWGKYLGTAVISGAIVWATSNKLPAQKVVEEAVKQGITVVAPAVIDSVASEAQVAINRSTMSLPPEASAAVRELGVTVSDQVTGALKQAASNFPVLPSL